MDVYNLILPVDVCEQTLCSLKGQENTHQMAVSFCVCRLGKLLEDSVSG